MSLSPSISRLQDVPGPRRAPLPAEAPIPSLDRSLGKCRPVVVLDDGSDAARNAALRAALIARALDAPVFRVSARPSGSSASRDGAAMPGWPASHTCANDDLVPRWGGTIEDAGLLVTTVGQFQLADVVLGTHVEQLIREFRLPVLVVRQPASRRYRRVLVGVKLEARASALVAHARVLAPRAWTQVVHVLASSGDFGLRIADASEAAIRTQRARVHRTASRHVNGLIAASQDGAGRATVSRLSVGSAPDRLLEMSRSPRAELVVLGKRPRHWLADFFLDRGVARRVLAEGDADVLLVPELA